MGIEKGSTCKPSLYMIREHALSPKDFQNSTSNQVVHAENHPK